MSVKKKKWMNEVSKIQLQSIRLCVSVKIKIKTLDCVNLKGYSTQNENFVINQLPPCRSKPVKALFVFGAQFKIF